MRVTCHGCRLVRLLDREELIAARFAARQSTAWEPVRRGLACGGCGGRNVQVDGVPFGQDAPELRRRRAATTTIGLALAILLRGAYPAGEPPLPAEAVRLALRALHPHVEDRGALVTFWRQWSNPNRMAHESPASALGCLVTDLVKRGFVVPETCRWLAR